MSVRNVMAAWLTLVLILLALSVGVGLGVLLAGATGARVTVRRGADDLVDQVEPVIEATRQRDVFADPFDQLTRCGIKKLPPAPYEPTTP